MTFNSQIIGQCPHCGRNLTADHTCPKAMTDTPRTDTEEYETDDGSPYWRKSVDADFARQLERDLSAAQRELAEARSALALAERRGMEWAAKIVSASRTVIAQHIKPYEPINDMNVKMLLEDCDDACADLSLVILTAAEVK